MEKSVGANIFGDSEHLKKSKSAGYFVGKRHG